MRVNPKLFLNTISTRMHTLPIVILYVTEACNLRCVMCSYREAQPLELALHEIRCLATTLQSLGLQNIVYSGGEPLLRRDFPDICHIFESSNVRQTLLTNGLLLEKRWNEIENFISEVIVSLDGATPSAHNAIRGVSSYDIICNGIVKAAAALPVGVRIVIQRKNFREMPAMVKLAAELGVRRVSFLPVDTALESFGRVATGTPSNDESAFLLTKEEISELRTIIHSMARDYESEFKRGFIAESPAKLLRMADYFEAKADGRTASIGQCNAPMVSCVVTATGEVRPCFFLPSLGNIRTKSLTEILNCSPARRVRQDVRLGLPEPCKGCVCSIYVSPRRALIGNLN